MQVDVPHLVSILRSLPGRQYFTGDVMIKLDVTGMSLLIVSKGEELTDEAIDLALAELALNHG